MSDDDFDDEDTAVTDARPTPSQGTHIPDFEQGFALGHQRGVADMVHALRLALLRVGVEAHEVEPIVMRVRAWMR